MGMRRQDQTSRNSGTQLLEGRPSLALRDGDRGGKGSAGFEVNNPVGGGTEASCSGIAVYGSSEHQIFLAQVLLTQGCNSKLEPRLRTPSISATAFIGQGLVDETGIVWRFGARSTWILPKCSQIGRKASLGISRRVDYLTGVYLSHAADRGRFIGGNFRAQQVGNGDCRHHQDSPYINALPATSFTNFLFLTLKADHRPPTQIGQLPKNC